MISHASPPRQFNPNEDGLTFKASGPSAIVGLILASLLLAFSTIRVVRLKSVFPAELWAAGLSHCSGWALRIMYLYTGTYHPMHAAGSYLMMLLSTTLTTAALLPWLTTITSDTRQLPARTSPIFTPAQCKTALSHTATLALAFQAIGAILWGTAFQGPKSADHAADVLASGYTMLAAGLLASLLVLTAITLALARYTWSTRLCAPSEQHGVIPRERMRAALRFCAAATVLLGVQTLCRLGRHGVVFTQSNGAFLQFYLRHYGARTEYYLWVGEAGPLMFVFVLFCCPATCPLPLCATVLGGRSIDDGTAVGLPVWRQYSMQRRFLAAAAAAHESRAGHVSRQQYPAVPVEAAAAAAVAAPPRVSVDTHKIAVDGEMYRCVHCAAKSPL